MEGSHAVLEAMKKGDLSPGQRSIEQCQLIEEPDEVHPNSNLGPEEVPRKRFEYVLDGPL